MESKTTPQVASSHRRFDNPLIELIVVSCIFIFVLLFLSKGSNLIKSFLGKNENLPKNSISPTPANKNISLTLGINFPFSKEGKLYLYDDGEKNLIAAPSNKSDGRSCYDLTFPQMSPSGRYVAYIEQRGSDAGEAGCSNAEGYLNIYDTEKKELKKTTYKAMSFNWTPNNKIKFYPQLPYKNPKIGDKIISEQIFFDPVAAQEKVYKTTEVFEETFEEVTIFNNQKEKVSRGVGNVLSSADYPSDLENKLVRYKNKQYYLVDPATGKEKLLFGAGKVEKFLGLSSDGTVALFLENSKETEIERRPFLTWITVKFDGPTLTQSKLKVLRGYGSSSTPWNLIWYFDLGFASPCSDSLSFVDAQEPIQLIDLSGSKGAVCNSIDNLLAMSPDGNNAFLKVLDHFEIHEKAPDGKIIKKNVVPEDKSSLDTTHLTWINNKSLVIYTRTKIYLYEKETNTIKLLLENASI